MAGSVMQRNLTFRWHYENGLALKAIEQVWLKTRDIQYWQYIKDSIDPFITPDGVIKSYSIEEYNLDQINPGRILFPLYRTTRDERYRQALYLLREQLRTHPRTSEGGFWHKKIYPHQMWLDGIYMASPFYAEFAAAFGEPQAFDDVAHQILLIARRALDARTGLLYHGWDESKQQRWADGQTGCSPHFWGRAMGWYAMAIVDVLDYLPSGHPQRAAILRLFDHLVQALAQVQDQPTGLWYQVLDQGERTGNYLEASASCMFVYAIAKGVRRGYLPTHFLDLARKGYLGILGNLIEIDARGLVNLNHICAVAGLGGTPYRDGSYEYYVSTPVVTNDYKGVGAFILASVEMESI
jgi:unsaturated rhamnogalacturonyl hydrolase